MKSSTQHTLLQITPKKELEPPQLQSSSIESSEDIFSPIPPFQKIESQKAEKSSHDYWKCNHLLVEEDSLEQTPQPSLKYVISFEERAMENHGKQMIRSYLNFHHHPKNSINGQEQICFTLPQSQGLISYLASVPKLPTQVQQNLIMECKSCFQAKNLLNELLTRSSEQMHHEICLIFNSIIRVFRQRGLSKINQKKLFKHIEENEEQLENEVLERLSELNEGLEETSLGYLNTWIESIFLGLKGIYEREKRFRNFIDFEEDSDWSEEPPRKRTKIL